MPSENGIYLEDLVSILEAEVLSGGGLLSRPIRKVAATDMMSRVLASSEPGALLLTGLTNIQVVKTAEVADLAGVVFVNNVRPSDDVISRAEELSIPTFLCNYSMYIACGRLYEKGLAGL